MSVKIILVICRTSCFPLFVNKRVIRYVKVLNYLPFRGPPSEPVFRMYVCIQVFHEFNHYLLFKLPIPATFFFQFLFILLLFFSMCISTFNSNFTFNILLFFRNVHVFFLNVHVNHYFEFRSNRFLSSQISQA